MAAVQTPEEFLREYGEGVFEKGHVSSPIRNNQKKPKGISKPSNTTLLNIAIVLLTIIVSVSMQMYSDSPPQDKYEAPVSSRMSEKSFQSLVTSELDQYTEYSSISSRILEGHHVVESGGYDKFSDRDRTLEDSKKTFMMLFDALKARSELATNTKQLGEEIKSLKSKLKSEMEIFSKKTQALSNFFKDYEILNQNLNSINSSMRYLKDDMNERMFSLHELNTRMTPLSVQMQSLKQEISEKTSTLKRLLEKELKLGDDLKYAEELLSSASYTESVKKRAIESLRDQIEGKESEIVELDHLVAVNQNSKNILIGKLDAQSKELEVQRKKISKFELIHKSEEKEVALSGSRDVENQINHLVRSIQELEDMRGELDQDYVSSALQQKKEKLSLLRKYEQDLRSKRPSDTMAALKAEKDILAEKESEYTIVQKEVLQLEDEIRSLGMNKNALLSKIEKLRFEIKDLELELETQSVSGVKKRISSLEEKLSIVKGEINSIRIEKTSLGQELESISSELDRVLESSREVESRISDIRSEISAKDKHFNELLLEKESVMHKCHGAASQSEDIRTRISKHANPEIIRGPGKALL